MIWYDTWYIHIHTCVCVALYVFLCVCVCVCNLLTIYQRCIYAWTCDSLASLDDFVPEIDIETSFWLCTLVPSHVGPIVFPQVNRQAHKQRLHLIHAWSPWLQGLGLATTSPKKSSRHRGVHCVFFFIYIYIHIYIYIQENLRICMEFFGDGPFWKVGRWPTE